MSNLVGYLDLHHPVDETNLVKPKKVESEIINILAHKIILAISHLASQPNGEMLSFLDPNLPTTNKRKKHKVRMIWTQPYCQIVILPMLSQIVVPSEED